jgi:hypothetical protein
MIKDLGNILNGKTTVRHWAVYKCPKCGDHFTRRVDAKKVTCNKHGRQLHGQWNTRLYYIWNDMKNRCYNPNANRYDVYGKEGVTVYNDWHNFKPFYDWAIANGYRDDLFLDKDILCNKLGISPKTYSPKTCKWVSLKVQNRATRKIQKNNTSGYRGVSKSRSGLKWRSRITVDLKEHTLGSFEYPWTAAYAYDAFIMKNNLEHTKNFTTVF